MATMLYEKPEINSLQKWSGRGAIPPIGTDIKINVNGIGEAKVIGYSVIHGWIALMVFIKNPPPWYLKQNGGSNPLCEVFGAEYKDLEG